MVQLEKLVIIINSRSKSLICYYFLGETGLVGDIGEEGIQGKNGKIIIIIKRHFLR